MSDAPYTSGSAADPADADPEAIRAEIRETRDRLGDTLEQISERLNPTHVKEQLKEQVTENVNHLKEQVKDQVRETVRNSPLGKVSTMAQSAVSRVTSTQHGFVDSIRENPIPAALIAIGLGWLLANRRNQAAHNASAGSSYPDARYSVPIGRPYYGSGTSDAYRGGSYGTAGSSTAGSSSSTSGIADRASDLAQNVRDSAGQLVDRAQDVASSAADRAQDMASSVADQTRYRARRVEDRYYENPLVFGAATLAAGLVAGLSVPATQREVNLMGETRDRLLDQAKETAQHAAQQAKEQAQQVATRVVSDVKTVASDATSQSGQPAQGGSGQSAT